MQKEGCAFHSPLPRLMVKQITAIGQKLSLVMMPLFEEKAKHAATFDVEHSSLRISLSDIL